VNDATREPILQFFAYSHLRPELQAVSRPFGELASLIVKTLPRCAERTAGLRKLLEAKDCAVRAHLYRDDPASWTVVGEDWYMNRRELIRGAAAFTFAGIPVVISDAVPENCFVVANQRLGAHDPVFVEFGVPRNAHIDDGADQRHDGV
jgi:hypothetical protein